jgi:alpha-tubulin suppressor-like RCC1 family protein
MSKFNLKIQFGEQGRGTFLDQNTPNFVIILLNSSIKIVDISAGSAVMLALSDVGNVYAWGRKMDNGTNTATPTFIFSNIKKISASEYSSFLLNATGSVYSFGEGFV